MIKAIFFDAAGTLIYLRKPVGQTYAKIAAGHGLEIEPSLLERAFKTTWKTSPAPVRSANVPSEDDDRSWWHDLAAETFRSALGKSVSEETFEPLFENLYTHFAKPEAWQVYDDTFEALEFFKRQARLFVLSNFDRRLHSVLEGLKLTPFFENVLVSSEIGFSKPDPRIFEAALQIANVPASACLHIGDDDRCDFQGAQSAGWQTFLLQRPTIDLLSISKKLP